MVIIKCILLIALLQYSYGETLENRIRRSPRKTKAPVTAATTTTSMSNTNCGAYEKCTDYRYCDNVKLNTEDNMINSSYFIDGKCSHYLDVCCESQNIRVTPLPITENFKISIKCGFLNPNGVGMRIKETSDHEAEFGEFPWMVLVLKNEIILDQITSVYHCGGSLIHPSVVLTAGHKVVGENPLTLSVRAGEWDTQTARKLLPFVESNVASITTNKNLHLGTGTYNIALLFLKTPIENDKHINTICLPPRYMNFDGARCFVTGWGKDKFGKDGSYQYILKKIDLPVVERQTCTEILRKTRLGKLFNLNESLICAGGEAGKDSCKGDGGSPLVCPIPGNSGYYYQAGIVSWGIKCREDNTPGAYTEVAFFADWIEEQIQYKGYNSSSYKF